MITTDWDFINQSQSCDVMYRSWLSHALPTLPHFPKKTATNCTCRKDLHAVLQLLWTYSHHGAILKWLYFSSHVRSLICKDPIQAFVFTIHYRYCYHLFPLFLFIYIQQNTLPPFTPQLKQSCLLKKKLKLFAL